MFYSENDKVKDTYAQSKAVIFFSFAICYFFSLLLSCNWIVEREWIMLADCELKLQPNEEMINCQENQMSLQKSKLLHVNSRPIHSVAISTAGPQGIIQSTLNFCFVRIIGNGSFGVVVLIRDSDNGRFLAIKKVFQDPNYQVTPHF